MRLMPTPRPCAFFRFRMVRGQCSSDASRSTRSASAPEPAPCSATANGEVERIEALGLWRRQPNATLYVAALAVDALQFAQARQIARIIGTILRRFHGDFFVLAGECGKLQSLEMIIQLGVRRSPALRSLVT